MELRCGKWGNTDWGVFWRHHGVATFCYLVYRLEDIRRGGGGGRRTGTAVNEKKKAIQIAWQGSGSTNKTYQFSRGCPDFLLFFGGEEVSSLPRSASNSNIIHLDLTRCRRAGTMQQMIVWYGSRLGYCSRAGGLR